MSEISEKDKDMKGDFSETEVPVHRYNQVVAIYDLVGFTDHLSNRRMHAAVQALQEQIRLHILPLSVEFGNPDPNPSNNTHILLRSTGDGYVIAFSEVFDDLRVFQSLVSMHKDLLTMGFPVNLGINKGANYVTVDLNKWPNVIGWGVNHAARALQHAQENHIILTSYVAEPLLLAHGDTIHREHMKDLGLCAVKKTILHLYNYHKPGEFGSFMAPSHH